MSLNSTTYARSPHWRNGRFHNQVPTHLEIHARDLPGLLKAVLFPDSNRAPKGGLPIVRVDPTALLAPPSAPRLTWFGHSALLLEMSGKIILLDPMLGNVPAPLPFLGRKRYTRQLPIEIDELPEVDVVVISHDHYDHLDRGSILKLRHRTRRWITSLGVARRLIRWGVPSEHITELDWGEHAMIDDVKFTAAPARHFSGRGLWDRYRTFWSSFVIDNGKHRLYFNADSGYGAHFAEIGAQYGPFDLALMECGQYNEKWQAIHMMPEEAVQAALDLNATVAMPIHWGAFTLALHPWYEPPQRFTDEARRVGLRVTTPMIGEAVIVGEHYPDHEWWK